MKYTFGIMSAKYELECDDEIIAEVAMCIYMKTPVPIVIYSPVRRGLLPSVILKESQVYCENNAEKLRDCILTIHDLNCTKDVTEAKE